MARNKPTAEQQLATLREAIASAGIREREQGAALANAKSRLTVLTERRVLALSHDDEAEAAKLAEEIAETERAIRAELGPRVEGAALHKRRAEAEVGRFVSDAFSRLLTERFEEDRAATERLAAALAEVVEAVSGWDGRAAEAVSLAGLAPHADPRAVHRLPDAVTDVARLARRALNAGPIPEPTLGGGRRGVSIPDVDSPDPEVRERARARVIARDQAASR